MRRLPEHRVRLLRRCFPGDPRDHGFETFELFAAAAGDDWYVNPGNIP